MLFQQTMNVTGTQTQHTSLGVLYELVCCL